MMLNVEVLDFFYHSKDKKLDLSNTYSITNYLDSVISFIDTKICSITILNLTLSNFDDVAMEKLATFLATNLTITELNLSNNYIHSRGAMALAHALDQNHTLINLNLSNNKTGYRGAKAIAESLEKNKNKTLTSLDMSHNDIGKDRAGKFAKVLQNNTCLKKLNLGFNYIGTNADRGTIRLAKALEKNKTLTWLNLQRNSINKKGTQQLATTLMTNNTLQYINLKDNAIQIEHIRLHETFQKNYTITSFFANSSDFFIYSSTLEDFLKRNRKKWSNDHYQAAMFALTMHQLSRSILMLLPPDLFILIGLLVLIENDKLSFNKEKFEHDGEHFIKFFKRPNLKKSEYNPKKYLTDEMIVRRCLSFK